MRAGDAARAPAGRPHVAANVALGLISAALTAALFLVVLLLIEGWRLTPDRGRRRRHRDAGCALLSRPGSPDGPARRGPRAAAGRDPDRGRPRRARRCCPARGCGWYVRRRRRWSALGLALTLVGADRGGAARAAPRRRSTAAGRSPRATPASWSGLLLLTPVFTADLETSAPRGGGRHRSAARRRLSPRAKIELAGRIAESGRGRGRQGPDNRPGVRAVAVRSGGACRDGLTAISDRGRGRRRRDARVQRLVSDCRRFRPRGADPDRDRPPPGAAVSGRSLVGVAIAAATALVALYLVLGGGSYEPTPVADPCAPREWRDPHGVEESAQQFALSALDGAACKLDVSRETLAVALATPESRKEFAAAYGIGDAEFEAAVRAGVEARDRRRRGGRGAQPAGRHRTAGDRGAPPGRRGGGVDPRTVGSCSTAPAACSTSLGPRIT